MNGAQH